MEQGQPLKLISYIFLIALLFSVLFILDGVFGVHYSHNIHHPELLEKQEDSLHESDASNYQETEPKEFIDSTDSSIEESTPTEEPALEEQEESKNAANADDAAVERYFEELKSDYLQSKLKDLPSSQARTDVIIRYYHHQPDGESAYQLQNLRYYLHERPVAPEYANHQSNAVFYGDSVQVEDIQLVTYTLLKAGLPIKTIKPSKFASSWKARSIEIGTDTTLTNQPTLTLEEIINLSI